MNLIQTVNVEKIQSHVESIKEFQAFAKQLFLSVGEEAKRRLSSYFDGVEYKYQLARLPDVIARFEEEYGEAPIVGWVAMSFADQEPQRVHIGTLLNYEKWPLTYTIGFHLLEDEYKQVAEELHSLNWEKLIGCEPAYQYSKPNGEHMFNSTAVELNLASLTESKEKMVEMIVRYYEQAAPVVAKLRKKSCIVSD
ncbi:hypothetical protein AC623_04395 [Bacillus sp. FJAT-27231]|uniref:hypothetical protein n=1 Tax=Bacillus sp. FJAT-27231 TaxID=1679168 RepID=UPI0006710E53|nr:hypothetical protein [Bacillus sp. FJAT-27231]KMY53325.1 hypothetical protein AC623_04395 [Bacillus sp. FJAT-27231]